MREPRGSTQASISRFVGEGLALVRSAPLKLWLVVALVTSVTNALDFLTVPRAGASPGLAFAVAAALRVALVFWISAVAIRLLAGLRPAWQVDVALGRYFLFQLGTAVLTAGVVRALVGAAGPLVAGFGAWPAFVAIQLVGALLIRISPWGVALA